MQNVSGKSSCQQCEAAHQAAFLVGAVRGGRLHVLGAGGVAAAELRIDPARARLLRHGGQTARHCFRHPAATPYRLARRRLALLLR